MYGKADIDSATRRAVAPPRALVEGRYPGMRAIVSEVDSGKAWSHYWRESSEALEQARSD